ncbi:hypothetical protein B0H14DRAFT_2337238, partial [Mycena olivaceomarginata]
RNLVVCIDGTQNKFGDNNTNVVEICNRVVKNSSSNPQLTYYNSGIGTYARPSFYPGLDVWKAFGSSLDLAFALKFEKIVQGAYRWLSDHYQPGDKIYLFGRFEYILLLPTGFSRGAHQIRVLAGMISKVGLMYSGNISQIPLCVHGHWLPQLSETKMISVLEFKKTFSRRIGVHFLGTWETVTSIGFRWREPLPNMTSADHICFFRHALALDEHRIKFLPFYVNGGLSQPSSPMEQQEHIKEVWFAGSHSDVYVCLKESQ